MLSTPLFIHGFISSNHLEVKGHQGIELFFEEETFMYLIPSCLHGFFSSNH